MTTLRGIVQALREIVPTLRGNMKKRRKMPRNGWHFPFFFLGTAVAGARTAFSALSGAPVCVRKPYSLALRAVVRKPCRRPDRLFCSFRCPGLRTKTEFIGFAGSRTQTLQAPGPPFLLFPVPRFAYENRIHWLCGHSYANPAGARTTFSAL